MARSTGFAPLKALIEQQLAMFPAREMRLFWGATASGDFYDLDPIAAWLQTDVNLRITLVARSFDAGFIAPPGARTEVGRVSDAVATSGHDLSDFDAYVAGPRVTVRDTAAALEASGIPTDRIYADSYGL